MNTESRTFGCVVVLVLIASTSASPILTGFKDLAKQPYQIPPSFADEFPSSGDESISENVMKVMENPKEITDLETTPVQALPMMKILQRPNNVNLDVMQSGNSYPDFRSPFPSLRIGGSASLHFRFWKGLSKMAIPTVEFLTKSLERLVLNYCEDYNDVIPDDDCLGFSYNLVNNWNVRDFIRSPSDNVMVIKKQKKFNKILLTDVIQVLHYNRRNLTDLLSIEKQHICGNEAECDVMCDERSSLYCSLKDIIVPNMDDLILRLEKEANMYFGVKIRRQIPVPMSATRVQFYSKYRVFFVLGTMYNTMLQMYETEAALTYILDLSKIERLKVR